MPKGLDEKLKQLIDDIKDEVSGNSEDVYFGGYILRSKLTSDNEVWSYEIVTRDYFEDIVKQYEKNARGEALRELLRRGITQVVESI